MSLGRVEYSVRNDRVRHNGFTLTFELLQASRVLEMASATNARPGRRQPALLHSALRNDWAGDAAMVSDRERRRHFASDSGWIQSAALPSAKWADQVERQGARVASIVRVSAQIEF